MVDFATLAAASRPQMMPAAPEGAGVGAGAMYGMDAASHDNFLAKAAQLAQLDAQMKAMEAEEKAAGQPGRMAGINLGNLKSAADLNAYQTEGGADLAAGNIQQQKVTQEAAIRKQVEPWFTALAGTDEGEARAAYEKLSKMIPQVGQMGYDKARKEAQAHYTGQVKSAQNEAKTQLESVKGDYRLQQEYMKQKGANTRQEKDLVMRKELADLKGQNKPLHDRLLEKNNGDLNGMFNDMLLLRSINAIQQGKNTVEQSNALLPTDRQMPAPSPYTPEPSSTTPTQTTPKSATVTPKLGDSYTYAPGKSGKILSIGRDKKTGKITHLNIEGKGIIEYK